MLPRKQRTHVLLYVTQLHQRQQRKLDPPYPHSQPKLAARNAATAHFAPEGQLAGVRPICPVSPTAQSIAHAILSIAMGDRSPRAGTLDNPHRPLHVSTQTSPYAQVAVEPPPAQQLRSSNLHSLVH